MHSASSQTLSSDVGLPRAIGEDQSKRRFRVLFCSWTELDVASGTPMIICDMVRHFSPMDAEILRKRMSTARRRREMEIEHPAYKYRFHTLLWPFARGHIIRNRLARLGLPVLVGQLVAHIRRFRPDCIFTIYAQPHWIMATWIASRLTGVPLIYHIHDAFLQGTSGVNGQDSRIGWNGKRSLMLAHRCLMTIWPSIISIGMEFNARSSGIS